MQKTGSLLGKNTFISWFNVTVFFFFFFLSTSVALQLAKKKISAAALKWLECSLTNSGERWCDS